MQMWVWVLWRRLGVDVDFSCTNNGVFQKGSFVFVAFLSKFMGKLSAMCFEFTWYVASNNFALVCLVSKLLTLVELMGFGFLKLKKGARRLIAKPFIQVWFQFICSTTTLLFTLLFFFTFVVFLDYHSELISLLSVLESLGYYYVWHCAHCFYLSAFTKMAGILGYRSLTPKTKNLVVAGGLTAFVFGVYFYTMRAVGGTDELQTAIDKFEADKSK